LTMYTCRNCYKNQCTLFDWYVLLLGYTLQKHPSCFSQIWSPQLQFI